MSEEIDFEKHVLLENTRSHQNIKQLFLFLFYFL